MKKITLPFFAFAFLLFCITTLHAQQQIHVGFHLINSHDIIDIDDAGDTFSPQLAYQNGYEFRIGHDINSVYSIETGWILKQVKTNFTSSIIEPNFMDRFSWYHTSQIPLRLRGRWNLPNSRVIISPLIGGRLVMASGSGKNKEGGWAETGLSSRAINYTIDRHSFMVSTALELGSDVEFKLTEKFYLTTGLTYLQGFKDLIKIHGNYDTGNGVVQDFSIASRASYTGINIGFRYTFNPYWIKPAIKQAYDNYNPEAN